MSVNSFFCTSIQSFFSILAGLYCSAVTQSSFSEPNNIFILQPNNGFKMAATCIDRLQSFPPKPHSSSLEPVWHSVSLTHWVQRRWLWTMLAPHHGPQSRQLAELLFIKCVQTLLLFFWWTVSCLRTNESSVEVLIHKQTNCADNSGHILSRHIFLRSC